MKTITRILKHLGFFMLVMTAFSVSAQKLYTPGPGAGDRLIEEVPEICNMENVDKNFIYKLSNSTQEEGQKDIDQSFWFRGFFCGNKVVRFSFDDTRTGYAYKVLNGEKAGWVHVVGTAFVSEGGASCDVDFSDSEWNIDMWFRPLKEGENPVPKSPNHFDPDPSPEDIENWIYFKMDEGTITNANDANMIATLIPMDNNYGFQIGIGANDMNMEFGGSYWFDYTSVNFPNADNQRARRGDINVNMDKIECPPGGDRPEPCEGYRAFYIDDAKGSKSGVLYEVIFEGDVANFKELADVGFTAHLAYDADSGLIYVNAGNGSQIKTYNEDGILQGTLDLVDAPSGVINSVFHNGQLYLGSSKTNMVYTVNLVTGVLTPFAKVDGISGGDIAVFNNEFYSATRSGSRLRTFSAEDGITDVRDEKTPRKVNGMSLSPDGGSFIMTNSGQNVVNIIDPATGLASDNPYKAMRNGEEFKLYNGDLASGCPSFPGGGDPDECKNYVAYYASHNGGDTSTIYGVTFEGNEAKFSEITTREYEVHLTYNSDEGYMYAVNADKPTQDGREQIDVNAGTGNFIKLQPAAGEADVNLNAVYALVYDNEGLYMADANTNGIYRISIVGGIAEYSRIALTTDIDVVGGDLVVRNSELFLATRAGNKLYKITGGAAVMVREIPKNVNGIALSKDNSFISTHFGAKVVYKYDSSGDPITYNVAGAIDILRNGDLASGCADNGDGDPFCSVGDFENPGAEAVPFNGGYVQYSDNNIPENFGWSTTTSIEVQRSGQINGVDSHDGSGFHFELLSRAIGDNMYQSVATVPGTTVYLSFYHKKRPGKSEFDAMEVFAASSEVDPMNISADANKIGESTVTTDEDWKLVVVEYPVPAGQTETIFMLSGLSGSTKSIGNLIDDVAISCEDPTPDANAKEYAPVRSADPGLMVGFNNLRLYPVPAKSDLSIQVKDITKSAVGSYKIVSMTGRTTHKGLMNLNEGDNTITTDVSNLPIGMYFVVMNVEGKQITKQFAKVSN